MSDVRLAGAFLLTGGIINILFNSIAEGISPNYNVGRDVISDLGAAGQPTALLWNSQLFVTGLLYFIGMLIVFRSPLLNVEGKKLTSVLYLATPVTIMVVSLFPDNTFASIHIVGALASFVLGAASSIYAYKFTESPFKFFSIALGVISLSAIILLLVAGSYVGFGLVERVAAYPLIIWILSFGGYLMSPRLIK